jgi:hypothetical protein
MHPGRRRAPASRNLAHDTFLKRINAQLRHGSTRVLCQLPNDQEKDENGNRR